MLNAMLLLMSLSARAETPERARLEVASGHMTGVECALDVGSRRVSLGRDGGVLIWDPVTGRILDRRSGPSVSARNERVFCAAVGDSLAWVRHGVVGFTPLSGTSEGHAFTVGLNELDWASFGESQLAAGTEQVFAWSMGSNAEHRGVYRYHPTRGLTGSAAREHWVMAAGAVEGRDDEVWVATHDGRLQRWKVNENGGELVAEARLPRADPDAVHMADEGPVPVGADGVVTLELPTTFAGLMGHASGIRALGEVDGRVVAAHGSGPVFVWDGEGAIEQVAELGEAEDVLIYEGGVVFGTNWSLGLWHPERGRKDIRLDKPLARVAVLDGQPTVLGERGLIQQLRPEGGFRVWAEPRLQSIHRLVQQPSHLVVIRSGRPLVRWALDGGPPRAHADDHVNPKTHRPNETIGLDALAGTSLALERVGPAPRPGDPLWEERTLRAVDLDSGEVLYSLTFEHEPARGVWGFLSETEIGFSGEGGKRVVLESGEIEDSPLLDGFVSLRPRDGVVAVAHGMGKGVTLWEPETGTARWRSEQLDVSVWAGMEWDGDSLLGFDTQGEIFRVNAETGKAVKQWNNLRHSGVMRVVRRPGSTQLAMPTGGGEIRIWDPEGEKVVDDEDWGTESLVEAPIEFDAHVGDVLALTWLDADRLVTAGEDGVVHILGIGEREVTRLCSLYAFDDDSWAVIDPDGRYDASDAGEVEHLHWVVDGEPVALSQLKARYWHPGLLGHCTGKGQAALRDVEGLDAVALHPKVGVQVEGGRLKVSLDERSGGIGAVRVRLNGKEIHADLRELGARGSGPGDLNLAVDLGDSKLLLPGQDNVVEVLAENADGSLVSRGIQARFQVAGAKRAPRLFALVVGTSDYEGKSLDLRFAARDALAFASAVDAGGRALFEDVDVRLLATEGEGARAPTRANVLAELRKLGAETRPEDVVIVYVAGHGVVTRGGEGELQLLLADAWTSDLSDPAVREKVALSSGVLTSLLKEMPASKQVLVLDTCHSGKVLDALSAARAVPGEQIRALDRMKERAGLFVIAGSAADSVSYEATRYGQGLLTYSLLSGMRGAAVREGSLWDVSQLFGYASDRVPQLAQGIGGVQRPVIAMPRGGGSFDIGRVTAGVRQKIPLAQDRPVVLRSNFQDEDQFVDVLSVSDAVDGVLRDRSAGAAAPFVFVDGTDWDEAVRVAGRYRSADGGLSVQLRVLRGGKAIGSWSGQVSDVNGLAAKVVDVLQDTLDD